MSKKISNYWIVLFPLFFVVLIVIYIARNNPVFQTVISGTIVFIFGQIIQRFVLEPIKEHQGIIGEIDNRLKYYANVISNPGLALGQDLPINKLYVEATDNIRNLSCDLESSYKQIPFKKMFMWFGFIADQKSISDTAKNLILVANETGKTNNRDSIEAIRGLLKINNI